MNKQYFVLGAAILFILTFSFFNTDILEMSIPEQPVKTVTTMKCEISYFTVEGIDEVIVSYDHPHSHVNGTLTVIKVHGIENYNQIIGKHSIRSGIRAQAIGYGANYAYMKNVHLTTAYNNTGRIK